MLCPNCHYRFGSQTKCWIMIEATWSGYHSGQQRPVHREFRRINKSKLQEYKDKCKPYHFSDGTKNYYTITVVEDIRLAKKEFPPVNGYKKITDDIFGYYFQRR